MTTILITRAQRSLLAAAKATHLQGVFPYPAGWKTHAQSDRSFSSAIVDQVVAAGLMRRLRDRAVITEAGIDALELDGSRSKGAALPSDAKTLKQLVADAAEPVPEITHNADGSIEFTCAGCGQRVFQAIDDGFGFPACFECRWFDAHPKINTQEARP